MILPSLHHRKEGRAASPKRFRAATEADAAGRETRARQREAVIVVFLLDSFRSIRKTTPASLSMVASRRLFDRSATPPCSDARRGVSPLLQFVHTYDRREFYHFNVCKYAIKSRTSFSFKRLSKAGIVRNPSMMTFLTCSSVAGAPLGKVFELKMPFSFGGSLRRSGGGIS